MERDFLDEEPFQDDHIWPSIEGGPDKPEAPWNHRDIPRSKNGHKSAHMPNIDDVLDSSDPITLAQRIDKASLENRVNGSTLKSVI